MTLKTKCPSCKKMKEDVKARFLAKVYARDPKSSMPIPNVQTLTLCDDCAKKLGLTYFKES